MTTIAVNTFRGEIPRMGSKLLPPENAALAVNCLLLSGELRPLHQPELVYTASCGGGLKYAFRVLTEDDLENPVEFWLPFAENKVSFVKGPLVNDKYDRFYWSYEAATGDAYIRYGPALELQNETADCSGDKGKRLGVPRPSQQPSVTTEIWMHPANKRHFTHTTLPGPGWKDEETKGGDWILNTSNNLWYNKVSNGETQVYPKPPLYKSTVERRTDLEGLSPSHAWNYVEVTNDPNAEKNGWYITPTDADLKDYKFWRFTGVKPHDRWVDDSGNITHDAKVDGDNLELFYRYSCNTQDFLDDCGGKTSPPADVDRVLGFLDYSFARGPNTGGAEDDWGHGWLQTSADNSHGFLGKNHFDDVWPSKFSEVVTRAYVYTFVKQYGEEGPPSDPRVFDALDGENWAIHNFDRDVHTEYSDMAMVVAIRIYRTITGTSGSVDYFYVGEMPYLPTIPQVATNGIGGSVPDPGAHETPKHYAVTWNKDINTVTNVRPGDWLVVRQEDTTAAWIERWYKAAPAKEEDELDEDGLFIDPAKVQWVEMPGLYDSGNMNSWTFIDEASTADVANNDPLASYSWYAPEPNLLGLTAHPNGFLVSFEGRDVHFSEPYRPHAWPPEYVLSVEHPIVGLGVFDTSVVILTEGHPYIAVGIRPESMALSKHQTPIPCQSFDGIAPIPGAVAFPSNEGMYIYSAQGPTLITDKLMTEDEWEKTDPESQTTAWEGNHLVTFYDIGASGEKVGFALRPTEPESAFTTIDPSNDPTGSMSNVVNTLTDYWSGHGYIIANDKVYHWNPANGKPLNYEWISKIFTLPRPVNMGAFSIGWRPEEELEEDAFLNFNLLWHRSTLVFPSPIDVIATFGEETDPPQHIKRLPSGYKSRSYQFTLSGNVVVENTKLAETGAELAKI